MSQCDLCKYLLSWISSVGVCGQSAQQSMCWPGITGGVLAEETFVLGGFGECICNKLGKDRPRTWGKAGLGDRVDRRRLIRLLNNRHNQVMVYNDFND